MEQGRTIGLVAIPKREITVLVTHEVLWGRSVPRKPAKEFIDAGRREKPPLRAQIDGSRALQGTHDDERMVQTSRPRTAASPCAWKRLQLRKSHIRHLCGRFHAT